MYQPLNVVAVNCMPPTSKSIDETAGRAYQRRPSSVNHSNLPRGKKERERENSMGNEIFVNPLATLVIITGPAAAR